jgi:phosphate starvation-inducible PhoH-like protein
LELTITLDTPSKRVQLFGAGDANLRKMRELFDVHITARDGQVRIVGNKEAVSKAALVLEQLQERLRKVDHIGDDEINQVFFDASSAYTSKDSENHISVFVHSRNIMPRTKGQDKYVNAMNKNDMVFCTGPAGTGKTYLAVAMAVALLKQNLIRRIVLARPAVEAGEKLGFLPGDLQAKVNPYLRPLFDALGDMMEYAQMKRFLFNDIIEVVPLAFMRGRTMNDAVVILDEAQNTTISQMLMFLTRLGNNSKMIVTGDDSQVDLDNNQKSGLIDAIKRLRGIKGIGFIRLDKSDIVRHRLVQNIVKAYEKNGQDQV